MANASVSIAFSYWLRLC